MGKSNYLHLLWPDRKSSIGTGPVVPWKPFLFPLCSHWAGLKLKGEGTVTANGVSLSVFLKKKIIIIMTQSAFFCVSKPNQIPDRVQPCSFLPFMWQKRRAAGPTPPRFAGELVGLRSLSSAVCWRTISLAGSTSEVDWSQSTDQPSGCSSVFRNLWQSSVCLLFFSPLSFSNCEANC